MVEISVMSYYIYIMLYTPTYLPMVSEPTCNTFLLPPLPPPTPPLVACKTHSEYVYTC